MTKSKLDARRGEIDALNDQILSLIRRRGDVVLEISALKRALGIDGFDAKREDEMLQRLTGGELEPFRHGEIREIFKTIFRASLDIQDRERRKSLHVFREDLVPEGGIRVGDIAIGRGGPVYFLGPCSVETPEQMDMIAGYIARLPGKKILRAGAFKPRTNPYSFQGLREEGLRILRSAADRHGLSVVTEVLDTATLDIVAEHADMLQIGARNMYNTELLKAVGRIGRPVLLKRAFMATLEETLLSAEYILSGGNEEVVLCERGIRTFERSTRFTLDISAVPLLKKETSLPVIVDLSHALGRKDIMAPCGRAALAAGADGLMIEIHHRPHEALSDGFQQLDFAEFGSFFDAIQGFAATTQEPGGVAHESAQPAETELGGSRGRN